MTMHQENEQVTSGSNLLTPQEQAVCKQIATSAAPHSQRALALLALNEKSTQAQAAEQAGLSTGQVNYWIAKFRKQRLGIFPATLLDELGAEAQAEPVIEIVDEPEPVPPKADSAKEKTIKEKKDKKGKKKKKTSKKTRKARMAKKGKKNKKTKDKKGKKGKKKK